MTKLPVYLRLNFLIGDFRSLIH